MRQAVIVCGGEGRRLASITGAMPKGLVPLLGTPLLEYQLQELRCHGVEEVILCTGYGSGAIRSYFGDGRALGLRLLYSEETWPRGTAGAVRAITYHLDDSFFVIYGDLLFCIDLGQLASQHHAQDALATLVVHFTDHPGDSDLVFLDPDRRITRFFRAKAGDAPGSLGSAAVYVIDRQLLQWIPTSGPVDFGHDVFPRLIANGHRLVGYISQDYCKDIGQERRYYQALTDLKARQVHAQGCSVGSRRGP